MTDVALATLAKATPKLLYQALRQRMTTSSEDADRAYVEILQEMVLEVYEKYARAGVAEDERPEEEDFKTVAETLEAEWKRASGNPKRKLLAAAFFGYFNPKLYGTGMSKILWDYVTKMEYPDAVFLRKVMTHVNGQLAKTDPRTQFMDGHVRWFATECPVDIGSLDFEFAARLAHIGVVNLRQEHRTIAFVTPQRGLAEALLEFVWAEDEQAGLEPPPDVEPVST
jgi:hypothetical protein